MTINEVQGEVPSGRMDITSTAGADRRRQGYDVSFGAPHRSDELLPAQGGAEGTEERVSVSLTRFLWQFLQFVLTDSKLQFVLVTVVNNIPPIQQNAMKNGYDENNGYGKER